MKSKPVVNVGTIGHVDHGKRTLTAALARIGKDVYAEAAKAVYPAPDEIAAPRATSMPRVLGAPYGKKARRHK